MKAPLAFCLLASVATHALADSRLDEVLQNGTLTVCTTGDYKPYTSLRADGRYEGIDIAMVESLAKSLNANIKWVPTTWKTLMPDFLAQRCDIAVGGISVSLERQKKPSSASLSASMARSRWCAAPMYSATRASSRSTSRRCV